MWERFAVGGLFLACTSTREAPAPAGDAGASPALDRAAVEELEAIGYRDYEGKAVVTDEVPGEDIWPTRVTFDPSSGPICLTGTPYSAYYADRGSDDLAILLDYGGACWTSLCSANAAVDTVVSDFVEYLALPLWPGRFGNGQLIAPAVYADAINFADWNLVSVPYCDGSVFLGRAETIEKDGSTRYQHGRQNLAAALDLAVQHFPRPKRVFLGGASAGGYGTITATLAVRLRYPNAQLFVMNDSGPGLFNLDETLDMEQRAREWNIGELMPPSCPACTSAHGQLADLIPWTLEHDQQVRVSMASYTEDPVISLNLRIADGAAYASLLRSTEAPIHAAHPERFRHFFLPGADHVLSFGWNERTGDDHIFSEWVFGMIDGEDSVWLDLDASGPYLCAHTDAASCVAEAGCRVVEGMAAGASRPTFQGCTHDGGRCDAKRTCATPSDVTTCGTFSDSCIPNGWRPVGCDTPGCSDKPAIDTLPDCNFGTAAGYVAQATALTDCGNVPLDGADADMAAASGCALAAQGSGQPFRVSRTRHATSDELAAARATIPRNVPLDDVLLQDGVIGVLQGGSLREYRFERTQWVQGQETNGDNTSWTGCSGSSAVFSCTSPSDPSCFTCTPDSVVDCTCDVLPFGAPTTPSVSCTGAAR